MRNFFRNLEREGVEFILISGQAAVLYGAATFSEDFDLWVRPTSSNLARLKVALQRSDARIYKLTPSLTLAHARFGHGFHFTVPEERGPDAYLDVMARPPRVGSFTRSLARCEAMKTDWGTLPVVSVEDLVRLKLTRRFADYDVISNLVSLRLLRDARPSQALLSWAAATTFRIEDLLAWLTKHPRLGSLVRASDRRVLADLSRGLKNGGLVDERTVRRAGITLAKEIAQHQAADIAYWRPVIDELRQLRATGKLLDMGSPVL